MLVLESGISVLPWHAMGICSRLHVEVMSQQNRMSGLVSRQVLELSTVIGAMLGFGLTAANVYKNNFTNSEIFPRGEIIS